MAGTRSFVALDRGFAAARPVGLRPTHGDAIDLVAGTRSFVALDRGFAAARPSGFARPMGTM